MSPQDALNIINQLRLKVTLPGSEHDILKQAIEVLTQVVSIPPKKES
jgi:hypothetical protein